MKNRVAAACTAAVPTCSGQGSYSASQRLVEELRNEA